MSWQKETHEKRLDRFEQRHLGAQIDSRIMACKSRTVESRAAGADEVEEPDDPILSLIIDLARRIDGLERMTTNLAEDLLLGNRRLHRMRSRYAVASVVFLSCGLLAGAWVKYTVAPPTRFPARSTAIGIPSGPVAGRTLGDG